MTDSQKVKVLVCGDAAGAFELLFKRVETVNKKAGPFDLLLCVGEFFGAPEQNDKILSGVLAPPIPTYILGPSTPETASNYSGDRELCPNLTYLGKKGVLYTPTGLSIGYLSGKEESEPDKPSLPEWEFNWETVRELMAPTTASLDFQGLDVLLTSQWPKQVDKFASSAPRRSVEGSALISKASTLLKPRYHFAGLGGVHYERQPFRNHRILQEASQQTTRFIGLAKVGNAEKEKFLYAFNIVPMKHLTRSQLTEQQPDTSEFPYAVVLRDLTLAARQKLDKKDGGRHQYFFAMAAAEEEEQEGGRRGQKRSRDAGAGPPQKRSMDDCWFCLSGQKTEKHLVVTVGEQTYLALAKGPLTPENMLILPISHVQSMVAASAEVREEINRFKQALISCFAAQGKCIVFFERNYRTQHLQIQVVPLTLDLEPRLKEIFQNLAQMKGMELSEMSEEQEVWELVNEGCPYFCVELPGGVELFTRQMRNFPVQFGREVLASRELLNIPDCADWRNCVSSQGEETQQVKVLRSLFSKYDFTDQ